MKPKTMAEVVADREKQIARDGGKIRFWTGNSPDPEKRRQILVEPNEAEQIHSLPKGESTTTAEVFDLLSSTRVKVRRASCGLSCFCALEIVDDICVITIAQGYVSVRLSPETIDRIDAAMHGLKTGPLLPEHLEILHRLNAAIQERNQ